jgi:hypothetical protein
MHRQINIFYINYLTSIEQYIDGLRLSLAGAIRRSINDPEYRKSHVEARLPWPL